MTGLWVVGKAQLAPNWAQERCHHENLVLSFTQRNRPVPSPRSSGEQRQDSALRLVCQLSDLHTHIHIIKLSQYTHSRKSDYSKLQCDKVRYSQTILKYVFEPLQSQSTLKLFTLLVISYKLAFRHKTVISLLTELAF